MSDNKTTIIKPLLDVTIIDNERLDHVKKLLGLIIDTSGKRLIASEDISNINKLARTALKGLNKPLGADNG